jgi:hypothetical protein
MTFCRHGRACHHKLAIADLWQYTMRKSGKPDFRCHPRLLFWVGRKDVDACDKRGHDVAVAFVRETRPEI